MAVSVLVLGVLAVRMVTAGVWLFYVEFLPYKSSLEPGLPKHSVFLICS